MSFPPPDSRVPANAAPASEPRLLIRGGRPPEDLRAPAPAVPPRRRSRTEAVDERRRFRARIILRVILILAIISLASLLGLGLFLRHAMRTALPQIDGSLRAPGLTAPVTVTRDANGVPSITAASQGDLLFAQGFVTAQDRLWQMDALRRHASGELAEILGPRLVPHDRMQRVLQIRAAADRAVAVLPAGQLHQLQAYAQGVNAYILQSADHLPVEFRILHYTPAPWTPRDTLLVSLAMAQDLSTDFPTKLSRELFSAHLAPELLADLYPVGSWRDHPPGQSTPDLTSPRPELEQIPLDESQSMLRTTPQELLAVRSLLSSEPCEGCRSGSNNWAVAGSRSASGAPLLSNDMHLALGVPGIWYEAALHTTDGALDVTGLTLPGTPFVIVGRNAHVAWSFTNLGADVQDVYIERLRGAGDAAEFQLPDGGWSPVVHHGESIRVRGGRDVTLDVLSTKHHAGVAEMDTPIITSLYPAERRSLALAWTAYDPANLTSVFAEVNSAPDGASLAAGFAKFGGPTLNLIYADDQRHIGYHAIGRIPIRGLAVHHPVVAPPEPDTAPPPDEDDTETAPAANPASLVPRSTDAHRARLIAAAFTPRPRRSARLAPAAAPPASVAEDPPPPLRTPLDYTIGSPIPAVPVAAVALTTEWSGYIPFAELPASIDPATGFLATANARITSDDYPYAVALNWASPYRAERITRLLANAQNLTPADMLRMQMDVHSELDLTFAHHLAYALDHTRHNTARLRQAADILRRWDGNVDVHAAAPAIVSAARAELWPMLLLPQIRAHDRAQYASTTDSFTPEAIAALYSWGQQSYALEQLLLHKPQRWLPSDYPTWNDLLADAVDRALTTAKAPADLSTWSYSATHPVELSHPLLSNPLLASLLGVPVGSGPRVVPGDTSTIKATARAFGPSQRFTADLAGPDLTTSSITTGESGHPASPFYLDQLPLWLRGETLALPLHNPAIAHTLVLQP